MTFFDITGIIRTVLLYGMAGFAVIVIAVSAVLWVLERESTRKGKPRNASPNAMKARLLGGICLLVLFVGMAAQHQRRTQDIEEFEAAIRICEDRVVHLLENDVPFDSELIQFKLRGIASAREHLALMRAELAASQPPSKGHGKKGGKRNPLRGGGPQMTFGGWLEERFALGLPIPPTNRLTSAQYATGVAYTSIAEPPPGWTTNMPENAVIHDRWGGVFGVHEDCLPLEITPPAHGWFKVGYDTPFPECLYFTTGPDGAVICFDALVSGPEVGLPTGDTNHTFIAALSGPLSFATDINSRFWYSLTPEGGLATWENIALLRDTNLTATVQAVWSCATGAFSTRLSLSNTNVPLWAYADALTNHFTVGFQSLGLGERVSLTDIITYCQANGTREAELRFVAFAPLDPSAVGGDTDGDFLTDWEEVMLLGTNPAQRNSDGDAWEDGVEIADLTDPLNPDSDLDHGVDGDDPDTLTPYGDPDHADWLFRVINKLPPDLDLTLDSDNDGWSDWLEELLGSYADWDASVPMPNYYDYGDNTWKLRWFPVTVTLSSAATPPAVLWIGPLDDTTPDGYTRRILLRDPGQWTVWIDRTQENGMHLFCLPGQEVSYTVTCDDPTEFIQVRPPGGWPQDTPQGGPALRSIPSYTPPPPWPPPLPNFDPGGGIGIPRIWVEPFNHCFDDMKPNTFTAKVTPGYEGLFTWPDGVTTGPTAEVYPDIDFCPDTLNVGFKPSPPETFTVWTWVKLSYCHRLHHPHDCPRYWHDWSPDRWCPFCATHHGHGHIDLFEYDEETGQDCCSICGSTSQTDFLAHWYCDWSGHDCPYAEELQLCAMRNPDGTRVFRNNRYRGLPHDLTLLNYSVVIPGPCCLCPEHWVWYYSDKLKWYLHSVSGPVSAVTLDSNGQPQPFSTGSQLTEVLFVQGDVPSTFPSDGRILIRAQLEGMTVLITNRITVASARVVRNVNGSEAQSLEARLALSRTNGVDTVKVNRLFNSFYLFSDVQVDSDLILSVEGNISLRVWSGPDTNSTLLLDYTQPVANGKSVTSGSPHTFATHGETSEVWFQVLSPGTGTISYGFVGKGNAQGLSFTDTINIMAYEVNLYIAKTNLTLLETNTLSVTVLPSSLVVSNYVFEISRTNTPLTWYQWYQDENNVFTNIARTAGNFKVRASAYVNGEKSYSDTEHLEVQFPTTTDMMNNMPLRTIFDGLWTETKNDATNKVFRREHGCHIILDSATGQYGITNHVTGPWVTDNETASVGYAPRPDDIPATPNPTNTAIYLIGTFHTHTPTTYRTGGRLVGPSAGDRTNAVTRQLPNFAYDYTSGIGRIPAGHPLDAPADIYPISPPERRPTP